MQANFKHMRLWLVGILLCVPLWAAAKSVRWVGANDIQTWDIHSQTSSFQSGIHAAVYESLVYFGGAAFRPQPVLATQWERPEPTRWRFYLRKGVLFHDGSLFTADDVVFSLNRARADTSTFQVYMAQIAEVRKINAYTVDILTEGVNPTLLEQLTELRIMSQPWAKANRSLAPKDIQNTKDDTVAHRSTNGTGPYKLKLWVPKKMVVLERNPSWWGGAISVDEVVYSVAPQETRRAAMLTQGMADLLTDPSPQDLYRLQQAPDIAIKRGVEARTLMIGMDQFSDKLRVNSGASGNPLKDVRVRQALYQAIDMSVLRDVLMRDLMEETGTLVPPATLGWSEALDQRRPYSPIEVTKLLAEAGYPNGFTADFACPRGRYINDVEVCKVIAGMWAQFGIRTRLRTLSSTTFLTMLERNEADIFLLGWGSVTFDAMYTLQALVHSVGSEGDGSFNTGRFSNAKIDALIDAARKESDAQQRLLYMQQALAMQSKLVAWIPLYNQQIVWAMKEGLRISPRPDNRIDWRVLSW